MLHVILGKFFVLCDDQRDLNKITNKGIKSFNKSLEDILCY